MLVSFAQTVVTLEYLTTLILLLVVSELFLQFVNGVLLLLQLLPQFLQLSFFLFLDVNVFLCSFFLGE